MKNHPFIDGLRALAVLPVIFFHFDLPFLTGGYIGVDVFFVISGFLITNVLLEMTRQGRFSIVRFYERRARRILPALFLTCLLCILGALVLFVPNDFKSFSKSLEGVSVFVSNFIFARWIGYFAATPSIDPLLHTWSLAVEEQFYIFFPVILYMAGRFLNKSIYILFSISLILNLALISISPEKTFYLLHSRAWELLAGSILALHLQNIRLAPPLAQGMSCIGFAALLAGFFLYDRDTVFPGAAALLPVAATVLLIWSNLNNITAAGRLLATAPFVKIGLISYGLYLYHWPVMVFARYYLDRPLMPADSILAFLLIGLMAVLSYRFVEQPIRSGAMFTSQKSLFRFSALGLLLIGLIGLAGVYTKGLPARFDKAALQYATGSTDTNRSWGHCVPGPQSLDEKNICRLGMAEPSSPNFLVWGDSHAAALEPALNSLAQEKRIAGRMVTYSGCPSLTGVKRTDGFIDFSCSDVAEIVFSLIQKHKIKNLLLVTRWDVYALGQEQGSIETTRNPAISFQDMTGQKAFAASFKETVRRLKKAGVVNIWVMKQVPPQLVHVPSALAKAVYFDRDLEKLKRPYKDVLARRRVIDEVFAESDVFFIDPMEKFCPKKSACLIAHEGRSLYSDHGHLSTTGALWSQDMLVPFFDSMCGACTKK